MIRKAKEIRAAARGHLSGKWGGAVIITLVYDIICSLGNFNVIHWLLPGGGGYLLAFCAMFLLMPLGWSYAVMFLNNLRSGGEYKFEQLFDGFRDYTRVAGTMILVFVYTCLWAMLLIVPGIIKSYSYAMTAYILRDNPELKFNGAIERSMKMMDGHKADLFYLHLTFIGWYLLCLLTCGIGFLWLMPYIVSSQAHFYEDVKAEYEAAFPAQGE